MINNLQKKKEYVMKYKKILVPVDFSEFSDKAVEFAIHLGKHYDAQITLFHVGLSLDGNFFEEILREQAGYVETQMQLYINDVKSNGLSVQSTVIPGDSEAKEILRFISKNDLDLVIMGTHGRTNLKDVLLGSITQKVVRLSQVPVLTVRHARKKSKPENILVPIDFSVHSKGAKDYAISLAEELNAKLTFLYVVENKIHPYDYENRDYNKAMALMPPLHEKTIKRLKEFVGYYEKGAEYMIREGKAYKEIIKYAESHGSDLIVMDTMGMTGLMRLLMGSTAEAVVALAPCPVLVVEKKIDQK